MSYRNAGKKTLTAAISLAAIIGLQGCSSDDDDEESSVPPAAQGEWLAKVETPDLNFTSAAELIKELANEL